MAPVYKITTPSAASEGKPSFARARVPTDDRAGWSDIALAASEAYPYR